MSGVGNVSPLELEIKRLQDAGHAVYLRGWAPGGRFALVVTAGPSGREVLVASYATCNGLGRWECSGEHLANHAELYAERFPFHTRDEAMRESV